MSLSTLPQRTRVAIIGGGVSGLAVAIRLLDEGLNDFVILEKAGQLGGTWRENLYPGCACDVPAHLYSFSYAQRSDWTRLFAEQPEIQRYLLDVAERRGVLPHVALLCEARSSRWDEAAAVWRIDTTRGPLEAQFLVLGPGPLHEARTPPLPGLDRFAGTVFHSSAWRHDHDLRGRRVAVLGSGSSAIQLVPKIQPIAGRLFVFQRTPSWVLPKPDHVFSEREKWALAHVPGLRGALRKTLYGLSELVQLAQRKPAVMRRLQRVAEQHLERQVPDPALRRLLTPTFTMGCKRLLLSNDWYPALQADSCELVPHAVTAVTATGVVGADGVERAVDTIILATGFRTTDATAFGRVHGRGGRSLEETWRGSPEAYLGTTAHGFPNAFFMLGPNTGNGHGSAFTIIEAQAGYVAAAIGRAGAGTVEVRRAAQRRWNEQVQAGLATSIWNAGGCASWYLDRNGRNSTIYPYTTIDMRRRLRAFDADRYQVSGARPARPPVIELAGAVVAITGGARGIGLATARRFADAGAVVCIGDVDEAEARLAAVTLGPRGHAFALDVARRASFAAFVDAVEARFGAIDVLVNNAGVMPTGRFLDEPDEVDRATMAINHGGTALGMKLVLPRMIARGRGHVVNVASLAGKLQVPFMATYVASKHATVGLGGAVRAEIEGSGVTLTTVMPGAIRTRLSAGIPLGGLGARDADAVARAVVASVRSRAPEVVVPGVLAPLVHVYALAPRALVDRVVARLRPGRVLDGEVVRARVDYDRSIRAAAPLAVAR